MLVYYGDKVVVKGRKAHGKGFISYRAVLPNPQTAKRKEEKSHKYSA